MLSQELVRQVVMMAAIALAVYTQITVHRNPNDVLQWVILPIAALLAAATAAQRLVRPSAARAAALQAPPLALRLALAVLAVAAIAVTTYLSSSTEPRPVMALLLWLAAPVVATFAVRGWQVTPVRRAPVPWSAGEALTLVAILVVAALLRTLWIGSFPRIIFGDEPRVAMFLHQAYRGDAIPSFFRMGWNTWPVVGLSLQGVFAPLFGINIASLRLSSALMGTLGVVTTYLLARELFTVRTALFSGFLFAVCRTAIDFSRLGITHAQVLCLEPLAFFFLWRALNGGRATAYLWAGVTTAWCLYTYNAGQLVPPLVLGWLLLGAATRPARVATHWRGAALLIAAFALTLFPYLYNFTDAFSFGPNWGQWTIMARNRQTLSEVVDAWRNVGIGRAWDILSKQVWLTWLGFGVLPGGGYGLGYRRGGMLDDVSAALFVLGLGMSIRHIREGAYAFLLYWWLATVIAGGIVTIDPPAFVRLVGLLPALAILAALPLAWLTRQGSQRLTQAIGALVALALVGGAAWDNYRTYFVALAESPADSMSELARYMQSLPADYRGVMMGPEHFLQFRGELFTIEFPDRWQDVAEPSHFLPLHEPVTTPLTIVLGPTQTTLSDYLRGLYPNAVVRDVTGPNRQPLFFRAVELAPDEVRARNCLILSAQRADGSSVVLGCADPFAEDLTIPPDAVRLSWTGNVYWERERTAGVTVDPAHHTSVTIGDGAAVASEGGKSKPVSLQLPRGWQPIRIEETAAAHRALKISIASVPLTRWSFRPESAREGLNATYTREDGSTVAALDPQLNAFAVEDRFPPESELLVRTPFTASWRGALNVETAGTYQFEALGSGPYSVQLDGAELFASAPSAPEQPAMARAARTLAPGLHPIAVEFDSRKKAHTTRRVFQLFWTPPGGTKQLIPPNRFVPQSTG